MSLQQGREGREGRMEGRKGGGRGAREGGREGGRKRRGGSYQTHLLKMATRVNHKRKKNAGMESMTAQSVRVILAGSLPSTSRSHELQTVSTVLVSPRQHGGERGAGTHLSSTNTGTITPTSSMMTAKIFAIRLLRGHLWM
jgi:hypothetical protein